MRNYDIIKNKFSGFLNCWQMRKTDGLEEYIEEESACFLSMESSSPDGGRHGLWGITTLIEALPETDHCYIRSYNFVVHVKGNIAQQSAIIVGVAAKEEDEFKTCEFSGVFSNTWEKKEDGWKLKCIRLDIAEAKGNYTQYFENWHFEDNKAKWYPGVHMPVISGELDSPWKVIPENEEELTDEELVLESFSRYAYGIDTLSFDNLNYALSEDCVINMAPFGTMDKRNFMQTLKLHRKADWYWAHPIKLKCISFEKNEAKLELYRMSGHRQRHQPLVYTKDNIDVEYACARYEINMVIEDDLWKIKKMDYYLGIIPLNENREEK